MISASTAKLSTYLLNSHIIGLNPFTPPLVPNFDSSKYFIITKLKNTLSYPESWIYPVIEKFGHSSTSALMFSFLSGDNILIVHPDQETRLRFLGYFLNILPSTVLRYNRITLGCSELDGNENIVGVDQLPHQYRSHKKLYLPLDTIFVDLINSKVEGEGIKRSLLTDNLSSIMNQNLNLAKTSLKMFFTEILERKEVSLFDIDPDNEPLIKRIEAKLNIESSAKKQDWLMF
ncbi:MAG: hypothetical protein ACW99A_02435 [Candidatus Kariarchaeaceae archaeon]|jgi:hypothetical protein